MTWYYQIINDYTFYEFLFQVDEEEFKKLYKTQCPCCKVGVLHIANYARKPRGFLGELPEDILIRFSLCCSNEGCRKRHKPISLRFMDRKVYFRSAILLINCLRYGANKYRLRKLKEEFGVTERTIYRWRKYWVEYFPEAELSRKLQGYLNTILVFRDLPMQLLSEFEKSNGESRKTVLKLLEALSGFSP